MENSSFKSPYQAKIKIYSDGADKASMLAMSKDPLIQGLTTNPSLMKKAGISNYKSFCQEILSEIKDKPISFEVFADDLKEMKRQANEIKTWGSNVYVKIPITNSKGESCIPLVKELAQTGVRLNVTALLTMSQVTQTVLALKDGAPSIVSVFAGRIADTGRDPIPLMTAASYLCRSVDKNIELLWASSREFFNVVQAEQSGCHIITAAPELIAKIKMLNKDLTELSLDTVKQFKKDADAAGFSL